MKQEERRMQEKEKEWRQQKQKLLGNADAEKPENVVPSSSEEAEYQLEVEVEALKHEIKKYAAISGHANNDMIGLFLTF